MIVLRANFFLPCWLRNGASIVVIFSGKVPYCWKNYASVSWQSDDSFSQESPIHFLVVYHWFIKKIRQFWLGNFHWVRTVPVVHHLLKVSGLSRHASRLDSSYKMKFGTSEPGKQRDYLFRISVCPGNFPVGRTKKRLPCIYIPRGISGNLW